VGLKVLAGLFFAGACLAQQYELGGAIGYGVYRDVSVISPGGTATAGIRNRFATGVVFCENLFEHVSGEMRYLYQDGDPFISTGTVRGNIQGQSHAFNYDVLFQARGRKARIRPYFAVGVGAKYYVTTGPEPVPQPIPKIAGLVSTNQWRALVTGGGGVKYRLTDNIQLRVDFRDYITAFPTHIIVAAPTGTDHGIFNQFTPLFGVSYVF
jgi:opacity protein-like surface antigen